MFARLTLPAALTMVIVALAATVAFAAPSPARMIVFIQLVDNGPGADDDATVYVGEVGSAKAHRLTEQCVDCADSPRLSPNGKWIAFESYETSAAGIFVIHPDGTGRHRVCGRAKQDADCDEFPAWSPDGTRLAFGLAGGGIAIKPVFGGRMTRVPGTGRLRLGGLDWSPAGGQLAFNAGQDVIGLVGVDGSHPRRIGSGALEPRFAPDASRVVFGADDFHALYLYSRTPPRTTTSYPLRVASPAWWDNTHLFYATGRGLYVYDLDSGQATWVGPLPDVCRGSGRFCADFDVQQ